MALLTRLGLQRAIRQWRTDEPKQLAEQLAQHQQDVAESLTRIAGGAWPRLEQRVASGGTFNLLEGQLLLADTSSADTIVKLPEATGKTIGAICGVLKLSPQHEVRVFVPRGTLDGHSPLRIAPVGLRLFVATVAGWWSVGGDSAGEYVPSVSNESNLTVGSAANSSHQWQLRGGLVSVDGRISLTVSGAGQKSFEITLPINPASPFPNSNGAHGSGSMVATDLATDCQAVSVQAVPGAHRVRVASASSATSGGRAFRYHFVYRL